MKSPSVISAMAGLIAIALLTAFALAQDEANQKPDEIRALMVEHHAVLTERVEAIREAYQSGGVSIDRLLLAENDALDAGLRLAETKQERIEHRKRILENLERAEKFAKLLFDNGQGPVDAYLKAKADRIAAKIALLKEQRANEPARSF